jgi:hypothetical protein
MRKSACRSGRRSNPLRRGSLGGGRTWWAHFESTRINIEPIILKNKIEEILEISRSCPHSLSVLILAPFRLSPGVAKSLSKSRGHPRVVGALVGALGCPDFPQRRAPNGR